MTVLLRFVEPQTTGEADRKKTCKFLKPVTATIRLQLAPVSASKLSVIVAPGSSADEILAAVSVNIFPEQEGIGAAGGSAQEVSIGSGDSRDLRVRHFARVDLYKMPVQNPPVSMPPPGTTKTQA
jgi:hypothetical protein